MDFRSLVVASLFSAAPSIAFAAMNPQDWNACTGTRTDATIAACSRIVTDLTVAIDRRAVAFSSRGLAQAARGDHQRAIADYDEAVRLNARDPEVYNNRGLSYRARAELDAAITDYERAIRIKADNGAYYHNRGQALMQKGERVRAMADFDQAITLQPENGTYYLTRAALFAEEGNHQRALADLDRVVRLQPKLSAGWHQHAKAYLALGQPDRALADLEQALKLAPFDAYVFATRGKTFAQKGNQARALADYAEAIRLRPDMTAAYIGRAAAFEARGDRDRAAEDYRAAQRSDPRNTEAATNLIRLAGGLPTLEAKPPNFDSAAKPPVVAKLDPAPTKVTVSPRQSDKPTAVLIGQTRVALVVGNGSYKNEATLRNPPADAKAASEALTSIGFDVTTIIDADRVAFAAALKDFSAKADKADVAMVYYSGHGVQIARGAAAENYLLPVDAQMRDARDADDEAFSLTRILDRVSGAKVRLAVLDACRDNPFAKRLAVATRGASTRGLARSDQSDHGSLIAFATQPSNVALDGDGELSPFTAAFVTEVVKPGLDIRLMFARVRERVYEATNREQKPYTDDGLIGEVYLAGR